jgi:RNA polymerase sigma factor (sigma-70 family)
MPSKNNHRGRRSAATAPAENRTLLREAHAGDRSAYLQLFLQHLPALDRFVRHTIRYAEKIGAVESGLIDPCAIIDQVYIAALADLKRMPADTTFGSWLRYLALHITRQQIRSERDAEPAGLALERSWPANDDIDNDLWEFYQPDDVVSVEDVLNDRSATDPMQLVEQRETQQEIEQWIRELPPELREALQLRLIEGLDATEIAKLKHETTDDIRQAIRDACAAVRARINQTPL